MPLEHEITKKENNLLLKQYKILKRVKYLENDKIIYIKYYLGENKMKKQNMTIEDLALEMRAGFKSVNDRLDKLETKVNNIEREAIKHGWALNTSD